MTIILAAHDEPLADAWQGRVEPPFDSCLRRESSMISAD
jgi:hypothetical protein